DTPYVLAVLEPSDQFSKRMFSTLPARLAKLVEKARETPDEPLAGLALEFDRIVQGKPPDQWPELLGLDAPARSPAVLYGLGLWPVARLGLRDPARLRAVVERLAHAAHVSLQEHTLDGHAYWTTGNANVTVIAAVRSRELVV